MNAINCTVTVTDRVEAGRMRKSPAAYAQEILEHLKLGAPYATTFIHEIPTEVQASVEASLKKSFELWANSWIAPKCREIIAKSKGSIV